MFDFWSGWLIRSWYLRCAIAGILGGVLLVLNPDLQMPWQGLLLFLVGFLALGLGIRDLRRGAVPRPRKRTVGPTFEVADPETATPTTTTGHLIRGVRDCRRRQRRAED